MTPLRTFSPYLMLAGYLAAAALAALLGGVFTAKVSITAFYAGLVKPAWSPPGWLFGPVWTLLYICMALAMWLVWKAHHAAPSTTSRRPLSPLSPNAYRLAHRCWWAQLALNAAWPVVFWLQPAGFAPFAACALLAVSVWFCLLRFYPLSTPAAALMLPYALWVSFATALSAALWRLNSPL